VMWPTAPTTTAPGPSRSTTGVNHDEENP
jgi:hypothetical protein